MPHISLKALARPKPTMYLSLELIPESAWYNNVRSKLSKEYWDIIRRDCYKKAGYHCEICGGQGKDHPVECHEKWSWDKNKMLQKLVGFVALCPKCHGVKHIGYSTHSLSKTKVLRLYSHQRRINKWKIADQHKHFEEAKRKQEVRKKIQWSVDISYARKLIFDLTGEVPKS